MWRSAELSAARRPLLAQGSTESVRDYLIRLKQLGYTTVKPTTDPTEKKIRNEIMEEELLQQFIRGININLQHTVFSANPKSLDKASEETIRQERYLNSKSKTILAITPTPTPRESRRSQYHREYQQNSYRGSSRDDRNRQSRNSDYKGHYKSPEHRSGDSQGKPMQNSSSQAIVCRYCNHLNHIERFCLLKQRDDKTRRFSQRSPTPYRPQSQDKSNYNSGRRTPSIDRREYSSRDRRDRSGSRDRAYQQRAPSWDRYDRPRSLSQDRGRSDSVGRYRERSLSRDRYPNATRDSPSRR